MHIRVAIHMNKAKVCYTVTVLGDGFIFICASFFHPALAIWLARHVAESEREVEESVSSMPQDRTLAYFPFKYKYLLTPAQS